jgi:exodeoxyribonuclease III
MTLTVVSWNINGVRARLPLLTRYLEERKPGVLCLQETKVAYGDFPRAPLEALGYRSALLASGNYAGVAILARESFENDVYGLDGFEPERQAGRRLACRIGGVWIDTVYVPTRVKIGKVAFLDALRVDHARRYGPQAPVLLCGDFNICYDKRDLAHPNMITQSKVHPNRPEDRALRRLLEERGLVDCFRRRCGDAGHFSWFPVSAHALARNQGMRLDYIFASPPLADRVIDCAHDAEPRGWDRPSDHLPVRVVFADLGESPLDPIVS